MTENRKKIAELKQLLRAGRHAEALALVDELLVDSPGNAPLHWHRARCLEALDRPEEAVAAIDWVLDLRPDYAPAWLKRAELNAQVLDEYPDYEADVRKALELDPALAAGHIALAGWQRVQGRRADAEASLQRAIELDPHQTEPYITRARWFETDAYTPESGEETVKQFTGVELSRPKLEAALADLDHVLTQKPQDGRIRIKRAQLLHQLQRYDEALADYDTVLAGMPAEDRLRDLVLEMRRRSEGQGAGEREESARLLDSAVDEFTPDELARQETDLAISAIRSAAHNVRGGASLEEALSQFVSDDPLDLLAVDIAYKIYGVGNEPTPDYAPTEEQGYPGYQRRFAGQAQRELAAAGLEALGDYEPRHLAELLGRPTLVRVYRSKDGTICAASFKLKPKWPGWLAFAFLAVTGNWKRPAVVELETAFDDGSFFVTNNAGKADPFSYGGQIDIEHLPPKTPTAALVRRHRDRIAAYREVHPRAKVRPVRDIDTVLAIQRDLQLAKNAYRKSIGYVLPDELHQLLGRRYDELAPRVQEKLALLVRMGPSA